MKDSLSKDDINIQALATGNYILQIIAKDKIHSCKFIKNRKSLTKCEAF